MLSNREPRLRLVLDECVSRRLSVKRRTKYDISHTIDILGWGTSDSEIVRYLLTGEYDYFVTSDRGLLRDCERHGVRAVRYHRGSLYFETGEVVELGKHSIYFNKGDGRRAKISYRLKGYFFCARRHYRKHVQRPLRKQALRLVRKCAVFRARLGDEIMRARKRKLSKCKICKLQCRNPSRLANHLIHNHKGLLRALG